MQKLFWLLVYIHEHHISQRYRHWAAMAHSEKLLDIIALRECEVVCHINVHPSYRINCIMNSEVYTRVAKCPNLLATYVPPGLYAQTDRCKYGQMHGQH